MATTPRRALRIVAAAVAGAAGIAALVLALEPPRGGPELAPPDTLTGVVESAACPPVPASQKPIAFESGVMLPACAGIYVEDVATDDERARVGDAYVEAQRLVADAMGPWRADVPLAIFCKSNACKTWFGGTHRRSRTLLPGSSAEGARYVADRITVVVLRVDAGARSTLVHEMVHVDTHARLGDTWRPQWFDEALAVAHLASARLLGRAGEGCGRPPAPGFDPRVGRAHQRAVAAARNVLPSGGRARRVGRVARRRPADEAARRAGRRRLVLRGLWPARGLRRGSLVQRAARCRAAGAHSIVRAEGGAGRRHTRPRPRARGGARQRSQVDGGPPRQGRCRKARCVRAHRRARRLGVVDQPFSIALWAKPDAERGVLVHAAVHPSGATGWCVPLVGFDEKGGWVGQTLFGLSPRAFLSARCEPLATGVWSHFAMTWGAERGVRVYVGGELACSAAPRDARERPFTGAIDELEVFNYELGPEEVAGLVK